MFEVFLVFLIDDFIIFLLAIRRLYMTLGRSISLLLPLIFLSSHAIGAAKSFDGITCKSDIPSALIGRHMPNESTVATEERYKSIDLKDLGTYGMESDGDPWSLESWQICGREYFLLDRREIVKDVLSSPSPKENPKTQIVSCVVDGSNSHDTFVTFISSEEKPWPRTVEHAWRINDKTVKFSKVEGKEIVCNP
ncbi:hypothetical protein J8657_06505 [Dickeya oryzae]|uniref:Secreted effector protein n=1 Tax=Dickeya oryzae TaxID=1240404 RepID=A0AB39INH1_9GAMM|nr:hypothetical protein [Dickeya oryzae]MBP2857249.1 hypothetical protein [Dickeya oryzae]MCA6989284.1 hypothetical protein [Dickeya oryzae]